MPLCYLVCSTTIWVGHLPKNAGQGQIAEAFEEFGTVKSVDVSLFGYFSLHCSPKINDDPPGCFQIISIRWCKRGDVRM